MYSESDLDNAVTAGALTPEAAADFRAFVARRHTAPAVDEEYVRRALLVSALGYVLFAITDVFRHAGMIRADLALTALVVGAALLLLSAFWHKARSAVVGVMPREWTRQLPAV